MNKVDGLYCFGDLLGPSDLQLSGEISEVLGMSFFFFVSHSF